MRFYNTIIIEFTRCKGRKIHLSFDGGVVTSDSGPILLKRIDEKGYRFIFGKKRGLLAGQGVFFNE